MEIKLKITKTSKGFYTTFYNNQEFWIDKITPDDNSKPYWVWMKAGEYADTGYELKRDAIEGLKHAINEGWI